MFKTKHKCDNIVIKISLIFFIVLLILLCSFNKIYLQPSKSESHLNYEFTCFKPWNNSTKWNRIIKEGFEHLHKMNWCNGIPHFRTKPGLKVVLASFPGSGNTWMRHLLQQSTGIFAASKYYDGSLARAGFPAVGICNDYIDKVIAVKTHGPKTNKTRKVNIK